MGPGKEKTPKSIASIEDIPFKKALEKQAAFMSRLDGADSYDDVIDAISKAAVDDGTGELVVFDVEGYVEGYEDEKIEAYTFPLNVLKEAIEFVRDEDPDYEGIRNKVEHIPVRNAVIAIWAMLPPKNKDSSSI